MSVLQNKKKRNSKKKAEKIKSMPIAIKMYDGFHLRCQNEKSKNIKAYWVSTMVPEEDVWIKVVNLDAFKDYDIAGYTELEDCTKVYRFANIAVILSSELFRYEHFLDASINSRGEDFIIIERDEGYMRIIISVEMKDVSDVGGNGVSTVCTDLEITFELVDECKKNKRNNDDLFDSDEYCKNPAKVFVEDIFLAA